MKERLYGNVFSGLIHGLMVLSLFFLSQHNPMPPKPMLIDFTLAPPAIKKPAPTSTAPRPQVTPPKLQAAARKAEPVKTAALPKPAPRPKKITPMVQKPAPVLAQKPQPPPEPEPVIETPPQPEPMTTATTPVPEQESPPEMEAEIRQETSSETQEPLRAAQEIAPAETTPETHKKQYLLAHFNYIKTGIQNQMRYPRMARQLGWQGKVIVSFIICENGGISDLKIVESSGYPALDKNAMLTIQQAAPFPAPPVRAEVVIPVVYRLS